ncbi:biliverdin-producing heme oxygenase [Luteolibacter arcticus]|uniref:Biliverdin-producing heme oxygenase n=1 Tax=Luteolibacter arcticus TaxID=1581411 RepID=A0ABT3GCQ6_9BACT|nr:biliverdin-producing heme oxygenase [Luteolibacter arcticus]MCW1921193.1 biliverdin-producing heme oxygenase [Luteolibacter arcticus]
MTLLQALRKATQSSHQRLEGQISKEEVTASIDAYALYLRQFHQGLAACWLQLDWHLLAEWGLPELSARQARYHALTDDLHALGHPVPPLERGLRSERAPSVVGCLYVLEGSIHGGAILLSELETKAGPLPADTCRFLSGFHDQNRYYWKDFVSWLESLETGDDFLEAASTSAREAFEHFIAAFAVKSPTPVVS